MTEQFDGHLGGETARILSAVQDWARRTFPDGAGEHADGTCQWCPLCQFVAMLRGERPDVTERVMEAGASLLTAVRAFVDATAPPKPAPDDPARPGGADSADGAGARPRVQRIDLGGGAG